VATPLHPDPLKAASHANMFAHLSGPFTGGAVETVLAIDAAGVARVSWHSRLPLLLVAPLTPVGAQPRTCTVTITQSSGEAVAPVVVTFAPFSDVGSSVLAYRPGPVSMNLDRATPFDVQLGAFSGGDDTATAGDLFELRLVEGNLARMLYVIGAEKMRIRRQAAELYAARRLAAAGGHALDRTGADLGVPRFDARLAWDATLGLPTLVPHAESDAAYRARLAIYRPFLRASRRAVETLVNGPGVTTDPNRGLPAAAGITHRIMIEEPDTDLLVAFRLVSGPDDARRTAFLAHLRESFLLAPGAPVPDVRLVPTESEAEENALRTRLAAAFEWPANANIAPHLGRALDRVGACRTALGVARRWRVLRAQEDAGGSRYELGLGVDLEVLPAGELDALVANHTSNTIDPATSPEIRALLAAMTPRPASEDPIGRWLLDPCGVSTAHPLDATRLYASHLVVHGLVLGKSVVDGRTLLDARWNAPNDSGPDAVLVLALADADAARAAAGVPAWTLLTGVTERSAWSAAAAPPADLIAAMAEARLHMLASANEIQAAVTALLAVPSELVVTLQLDAAFAAQLVAHVPAAAQALRTIVAAFQAGGAVSILPLRTGDGRLLLVAGMVSLPGDATLLTARWRSAFRWYLVPIAGAGGELDDKLGSRNEWRPGEGLAAVIVVAAGRRGSADPRRRVSPFELRVSLPDAALVDLGQYEFLMNLFERAHPLGVIVDTRGIRRHIDADGDAAPEPLSPSLSRTFRPYRPPRRVAPDTDVD
jgi:hypothetical protein